MRITTYSLMMDRCEVVALVVPAWVQTGSSNVLRQSRSRVLGEVMEAAEMEMLEQSQ
jgi:hypothetical protein